MPKQEIIDAIAQVKEAMAKTEAALDALDPKLYVIMWDGSVLKTDGSRVGVFGPNFYTNPSRAFMLAEQAKWNATIAKSDLKDREPAIVTTVYEALHEVRRINADLIATMEKNNGL